MKRTLLLVAALLMSATSAFALTVTYGWEDGNTILGKYGDVLESNVTSPVYAGSRSLQLVDMSSGDSISTPQAYVAWIKGLVDGDIVTASFWRYDTTPGTRPSSRIWAHWNDDPTDVMGYAGSASGNNDYGPGQGWDNTSWSWTVSGGHTGLVVEVRTYSEDGDTVWVDDLSVTAPDRLGVSITTPGGTVNAIPEPASLLAIATGLIGCVGVLRRRRN